MPGISMKRAAARAPPKRAGAPQQAKGRGQRRMSTDESGSEQDSATDTPTTKTEGSEEEGRDDNIKAAIAEIRRAVGLDRDKVIDIADEVYHAHGDEAEEEEDEEWENSFDAPRLDFYFTSSCDNYQRTLVYRTALLFSSAPLSAPLHVEEYVEEWVDRCNVSIEGSGGPLTMEEEADFHLSEQRAKAEGGGGAAESEEEEEEEEEEEGEEEEAETDRKPYMIVFPSAKRVIDFIAYLGTEGLYNIWLHSEEGEEEPDEEEYTPTTRMWWRMNESEWIPAYC